MEAQLSPAELEAEEAKAAAAAAEEASAELRARIVVGEFAAIPTPDPPGFYLIEWVGLPVELAEVEKSTWGKLPIGKTVCSARYATLAFNPDSKPRWYFGATPLKLMNVPLDLVRITGIKMPLAKLPKKPTVAQRAAVVKYALVLSEADHIKASAEPDHS